MWNRFSIQNIQNRVKRKASRRDQEIKKEEEETERQRAGFKMKNTVRGKDGKSVSDN